LIQSHNNGDTLDHTLLPGNSFENYSNNADQKLKSYLVLSKDDHNDKLVSDNLADSNQSFFNDVQV
jgi:hypothetical protein